MPQEKSETQLRSITLSERPEPQIVVLPQIKTRNEDCKMEIDPRTDTDDCG